ncbi:ywqA [Symbiodinium natans]|uniref:YwqA protein n=1 Tax=Symbiodinium natans TaxID=878477 RepID=A0A812VAZ5_9DINO|nr:ywqA [Symbiodinium natans]
MGLGKTRQAIAYILGVREGLKRREASEGKQRADPGSVPELAGPARFERALVLAPAMLIRGDDSVWQRELREVSAQWQEPLRVWQWHGERACDLRYEVNTAAWKGPILELYDVVVTSYESFLQNQEMFIKESWTCIVLDEAQSIKNHATQTSIAVKCLSSAPFRLALTGTPIENSLDDVHSILQFVEPDCAGSLQDFRQRFPDTEEGRAGLRRLLQLITLRRDSGEAVQLVPKEEVEVPVQMTEAQAAIYKVLQEQASRQEVSPHRCLREMELLCTHPWCYAKPVRAKDMTDETLARRDNVSRKVKVPERFRGEAQDQDINDSGKLVELFNLLRGIIARRDKVLVFFCRTATSELLAALMQREFGVRPGILRGDTPHAERERIMREFKATPLPGEPQSQVLLLSVWVGAVGLNLPEARWVVHVERVWNPALERQATSRAHRLTSRHPVKAYCLFTQASLEERKTAVLSFKCQLSTKVMEALDLESDELCDEGQGEELRQAHGEELRALICAGSSTDASTWLNSAEDQAAMAEADPEESKEPSSDEEEEESGRPRGSRCPLHPTVDRLRPKYFKNLRVGKYGDPENPELWDWYTVKGHREVHERAPSFSTAHLKEQKPGTHHPERWHRSAIPFTSRPSRIRDVRDRGDRTVTLVLADGVSCRLFIPSEHQHLFSEDERGIFARPAERGEASFPVLSPSFGRSALDEEVGLLDIAPGMVSEDGSPLKFLQIVAVKPSEVEKYRMSAPFFVVMELPTMPTVTHPCYGRLKPEDLGVGCARHWLVRLAAALRMPYAFFLDDTVRGWRGVTLVNDEHCLFGAPASTKAQFTPVPLARVMSYIAEPKFFAEEMPGIAAFGFCRLAPELLFARNPHSRAQVYSGFLLNILKIEKEGLNFKQEVFVWEDIVFNLEAHDVVRSNRFAMLKIPFNSGGCSEQVARTAKPFVRAAYVKKMTGEELVAETLGQAAVGKAEPAGGRGKRGRGKVKGPPEVQPEEERPVPSDPFLLEEDPALKPEGAVVDDSGLLVNKYYKRFIQAFKDAEKARADVAAPVGIIRPGVRRGEQIPAGIMFWDDSLRSKKGVTSSEEQWGAGYIAKPYGPVKKSKWFNVKTWGCWRMAFVLARLQFEVWQQKHPDVFPSKMRSDAQQGSKKKLQAKSSARPGVKKDAKGSKKGKENVDPSTLHKFFANTKDKEQAPEKKVKVKVERNPKQKKLFSWMGAGQSQTPPAKRQRGDEAERHPTTP